MKKYFIVSQDAQEGPFSISELKEKKILKDTLVWTDTMEEWAEASTVEELKEVIVIPPPIPTSHFIKTDIGDAKKEKSISSKNKEVFAKEIKMIFKQIQYGFIVAVLSFPLFYFVIYKVNKYDNIDLSQFEFSLSTMVTPSNFDLDDFPFAFFGSTQDDIRNNIKKRKSIYFRKSAYDAFITFILASGILIMFRYASKGTKWVNENSKKTGYS